MKEVVTETYHKQLTTKEILEHTAHTHQSYTNFIHICTHTTTTTSTTSTTINTRVFVDFIEKGKAGMMRNKVNRLTSIYEHAKGKLYTRSANRYIE